MSRGVALVLPLLFAGAVEAGAQNVVVNPGFTGTLSPWNALPAGNYSASWTGAVGHNTPGAAFVDITVPGAGTEAYALTQCVPVLPASLYDVGGSFMYPSSVGTTPTASIVLRAYTDGSCTTSAGSLAGFGLIIPATPDTWATTNYPSPGGYTTPATAHSVLIYLMLRTPAAGLSSGWFDDINLSRTEPVELERFSID